MNARQICAVGCSCRYASACVSAWCSESFQWHLPSTTRCACRCRRARAAGVAAWGLRWHCSSAQLWWPRRQHQPAGVQYHRLWRGAAGRRAASGGRRRDARRPPIGQHEHGRRSWGRRRRGAAQGQAQEARPQRAMKRSDQAAVLGSLGSAVQCMLSASNFLWFACDTCRCVLQHSRGEDAVKCLGSGSLSCCVRSLEWENDSCQFCHVPILKSSLSSFDPRTCPWL